MRLPPQPFLRALLLRALIIWAGLRIFMAWMGILTPNPAQLLLAAVAVGGLVFLEARSRREAAFLANLQVSPWTIVGLGVLVTLLAEAAFTPFLLWVLG